MSLETELRSAPIVTLRHLLRQVADAHNKANVTKMAFERLFWLRLYGVLGDAIEAHPECTDEDRDTCYLDT